MVGARINRNISAAFAAALLVFFQACAAEERILQQISLPPGFTIEVYADVPNARSLASGSDGTVFVSTLSANSIYAVTQAKGGPRVIELASDLDGPNGIAFFEGDLYVAETDRVLRYPDVEARLPEIPAAEVLDIDLPSKSHHGWRYIGFDPSGKFYISIGAPCNVCEEQGFARIDRMNPDGSEREVFASGVRNSVGFAWHPETGELWFTDNGRDMLGDDMPPDELNVASRAGLHFGFPYCHAGEIPDPEFGESGDCSDVEAPAQKLGPHVAALGLAFYTGREFPEQYRGQIFIAEHGSWNRSEKIGYRISLVKLEEGKAVSYEVFADGWLQGNTVLGRPVDVLVHDGGSLLVSDDKAGKLYRIRYEGTN